MIDWTKPVETVDGKHVPLLSPPNRHGYRVGWVELRLFYWTEAGECFSQFGGLTPQFNLRNKPETVKVRVSFRGRQPVGVQLDDLTFNAMGNEWASPTIEIQIPEGK